jgi:predicted aldo/keto reductase-like oxidoreductase
MSEQGNTRREFLQTTLAGAAALSIGATVLGADDASKGLPQRPLGKTGEKEAIKIMHAAIDEGINFFDNAWDYHDGGSETVMGKALDMNGKRKQVFLMTKNCDRDAKGTRKCLEDSLKRLQTDHLDLWQFHEINYDNDPDWVFEKGGLDEALKAQKEGKVRFLGFTGHKDPRIHLKMLPKHKWDTVQMPINACDYYYRSFVHQVVPEAIKREIAPIGMKSLGGDGRLIKANVCTIEDALRYSLSQPICSLVSGIDSMKVLKQNVGIARNFKPLEKEEMDKLLAKVKDAAGDGRHERFKSTQLFDGPYHQAQHRLTKKDVEG